MVRGRPDDTQGCYGFFTPVQTFFFAPNETQTFFSSQAKEQAKCFPLDNLIFCQFCEQTFYFLQSAEQTIFSPLFAKQFFFSKQNP